MKQRSKKVLALILAGVMAAGCLAGCGSKQTDDTSAKVSESTGSESTKPGASESTKPGASESTKPSESESTKPGASESTKPSESESTKPSESESTKPGESESTKPSEAEKPAASEASGGNGGNGGDNGNTGNTGNAGNTGNTGNGGNNLMSSVEIVEKCPAEYAGKQAGKVEKKTYYSKTCEKNRPVNVILPSNYSTDKKYPVLYLLHGIFGHEGDMVGFAKTLQYMTEQGLAKEMIVVCPYMYASKTQNECTAVDEPNALAYDNFVNDLVDDLMPFIKENYSIAEGRENTAVAGFSMGGRESISIGLMKQDLIGYIGAFSPAPGVVPGQDWAMKHKGQFKEEEVVFNNQKPYLLMVCCGTKDGTVGQFPKSYHNLFDKNKVEHVWWEIQGADHDNNAINSGIYNFGRYVFK